MKSYNRAGIRVAHGTCWRIVRALDPGRHLRHRPIRRRVYEVAGPMSMWHVDGYHKLIRWKFVIHGGIDGFTRFMVMLEVADSHPETPLYYTHTCMHQTFKPTHYEHTHL